VSALRPAGASPTLEYVLEAIDRAYDRAIEHLYDVYAAGLIRGEPHAELGRLLAAGVAHHCDAHGKATAAIINYFKGGKP
jgi:hypothetical protein